MYELRSFKFCWRWLLSLLSFFSTAAKTRKEATECCIPNCLSNVIHSWYTSKQMEPRLAYLQCGILWALFKRHQSGEIYLRVRLVSAVQCCTYLLSGNHLLRLSCFFPLSRDCYILYFTGTPPFGHPLTGHAILARTKARSCNQFLILPFNGKIFAARWWPNKRGSTVSIKQNQPLKERKSYIIFTRAGLFENRLKLTQD